MKHAKKILGLDNAFRVSGSRCREHLRSLEWLDLEPRQVLSAAPATAAVIGVQPAVENNPSGAVASPLGLTPALLRTAYGLNGLSFAGGIAGNGAGQTIAIVDAYYDPTIASDLARFDQTYGLPAPASFTQVVSRGLTAQNAAWSLETALDVEWAHAVAPGANLLLVETPADLGSLLAGVDYARGQAGVSVVSMSWGSGEFAAETSYDNIFTTPAGHTSSTGVAGGVTFVASAGDSGHVQYPAASPNVLAVGGTTLGLTSMGAYGSESPWAMSGHGASAFEPAPAWQSSALAASGLAVTGRTTPDVAWAANPATGVSVYSASSSAGGTGWYVVGGTSVGAPAWSAILAIADQGLALGGHGSMANAQASLYNLPASDFHASPASSAAGSDPYHAVIGLGSPRAGALVPALVAMNTPAAPPQFSAAHVADARTGLEFVFATIAANGTSVPAGATTSPGGSSTSSGSTASNGITPLNPSQAPPVLVLGSASVDYVIPPPLVVVHLGSSSAPATNLISISLALSEEQPPSNTHYGQGPENPVKVVIRARPLREYALESLIDEIEPFQPVPAAGANPIPAREALRPAGMRIQAIPPGPSDDEQGKAALDRVPRGDRSAASQRDPARPVDPQASAAAWLGLAASATGGLRLAWNDPAKRRQRVFTRALADRPRISADRL